MKSSLIRFVIALTIPALAALGGATVFADLDDAPGGIVIGLLLILGAVVLGIRAALHSGSMMPE
jgi:hypothetical protein